MIWSLHIEGGPRRVNHAAVSIGNKIYSFGGFCSTEEYNDWEKIPVHVLDTDTLRWKPVEYPVTEIVPFQRYGHTTVAYGDKVYMWGGRNNAVACVALSCFDTTTLEWSFPKVYGDAPYAKDGHSACLIGNKMYIFGGFEYHTDHYSNDIHCLNLDTMRWTLIVPSGEAPSHRDFHTSVAVGDRIYVFGGRGDLNSPYASEEELYCPQVYYLDTVKEQWFGLNPSGVWPEGRRSHSAWYYEGYMYIFGGYNGNTKTHFNDLYRYSVAGDSWQHLLVGGRVPCRRRRQVCLSLGDKVYMFGGTCPCRQSSQPPVAAPAPDHENPDRLLDNSDLCVLDYAPTLKTLAVLRALDLQLDLTPLPRDILLDIMAMTLPNKISRPINQAG